ncbi:MAG: metal-sensitive transcriptional regulator [Anaerolineaceae bacterium]
MKIQDAESKARLVQRLRRIEGQLRGVQTMLDEERDCREIMQQMTAIRSAMQSASRTFLQDYAAACLMEMDENPAPDQRARRDAMLQEMIAFLDKAP